MSRESMMAKLGLTEADFKKKPKNSEVANEFDQKQIAERIEILEDAFAEFVTEVLSND